MGTLIGFAVGYLVGTSAGREGRDRALRAARNILASDQAHELKDMVRSMLAEVARQLGTGAVDDIRGLLWDRASGPEGRPPLSRAA
jgi:hypothetical protein